MKDFIWPNITSQGLNAGFCLKLLIPEHTNRQGAKQTGELTLMLRSKEGELARPFHALAHVPNQKVEGAGGDEALVDVLVQVPSLHVPGEERDVRPFQHISVLLKFSKKKQYTVATA